MSRTGKVQSFLISPRGDIDGVLLVDGTVGRFPPRASTKAHALGMKAGDSVTLNGPGGAYPQGAGLEVQTIALGNGRTYVLDNADAGDTMSVTAAVGKLLVSPRGEVDTVILTDQTIVRLPPPLRVLSAMMAPGTTFTVVGDGGTYDGIKAIEARTIQIGSQSYDAPSPKRPRP